MTGSSSDPLLRLRSDFPILETSTNLISNSLGAKPRAAARTHSGWNVSIGRALGAIDDILETGAWKRWRTPGSLVT